MNDLFFFIFPDFTLTVFQRKVHWQLPLTMSEVTNFSESLQYCQNILDLAKERFSDLVKNAVCENNDEQKMELLTFITNVNKPFQKFTKTLFEASAFQLEENFWNTYYWGFSRLMAPLLWLLDLSEKRSENANKEYNSK